MSAESMLKAILLRERAVMAGALLLVVALCWAWLLAGAGMMQDMDGVQMPMDSGPWTPGHAALLLLMWAVMMAAMMLPGAAPTVLLYDAIVRGGCDEAHPAARAGAFAFGYVAIWFAFSIAAVALQYGLAQAALLSPMMETTSSVLAGAVLIAAGLYQWSPLKLGCLTACRSPVGFLVAHWRDGIRGAFVMGARHGVFCLGCCWVLMLLLFVGGVMNLLWIAGLSVYVLVEKLAPAGHWIGRAAGAILICWGAATLLTAY